MDIKKWLRPRWTKKHFPFKKSAGKPYPLGSTITKDGVNFALFAGHASAVTLLLYEGDGMREPVSVPLSSEENKTGDIWHIHLAPLSSDVQYCYEVQGPSLPLHYYSAKNRLLDPYSKYLAPGLGWGAEEERGERKKRFRSCVVDQEFDWEGDRLPHIPLEDTIVYELHVRGFTRHPSSQVGFPGTYQGIIDKIPYLKKLGVTSLELLPIFEFDENDNARTNPVDGSGLKNYWGYSTISFFAPKAAYASHPEHLGAIQEFKKMVKALHKAGLEVILDVVFNHTAEGDQNGPSLHFRGLDNCVYYLMTKNGYYYNFSGCGNSLNCQNVVVMDFILDCLRYWVAEMHVDGFRFDLASILTRDEWGAPMADPPLISRIAKDPILKKTKLIAEPWDAVGLYQVGHFPSHGRWHEWNDKFRDDIRSFVKGDTGTVHAVAKRLIGSPDLYSEKGLSSLHSINFVTCHDGFTLHDLVSYNDKKNTGNGESNQDGTNNNRSWNCGAEGPTQDAAILKLRLRQMKNFLALLFVSQGIPMLLAGDEFGRTQDGNNNAYCQDNKISWIDWTLAQKNATLLRFTEKMIALRKRYAIFRKRSFQDLKVSWHGIKVDRPDWSHHSHTVAVTLTAKPKEEQSCYIAMNAYWKPLTFEMAPAPTGKKWKILVDTAKDSPSDIHEVEEAKFWLEKTYLVADRSVLILIAV